MPNGVICGGAADGSNQLGAIVTCHAMAKRPEGAGAPAPTCVAPSAMRAPSNRQAKARPGRAMVLRIFSSQETHPLRMRTFLIDRCASAAACVQLHAYAMTLHRTRCGWKTG